MSNNKKSSVGWLHIEFQKRFPKETYEMYNNNQLAYEQMILQAKAMHKEESQKIFECGRNFQLTGEGTFEQVYNETFGGNNEH